MTEEEKKEMERLKDKADRDAFAARLLAREKERTKKKTEPKESEAAKQKKKELQNMSEDELLEYIPKLREKSRYEYVASACQRARRHQPKH